MTVNLKIISGGQTGVDRAALDAALEAGFPCGGWCPLGRRAENGVIPLKYPLRETETPEYSVRTEWNVCDSDGTLIITFGKPKGGTAFTIAMARINKKPFFVIDLKRSPSPLEGEGRGEGTITKVSLWLKQNNIKTLNIAGPRESGAVGIYERSKKIVKSLLELIQSNC